MPDARPPSLVELAPSNTALPPAGGGLAVLRARSVSHRGVGLRSLQELSLDCHAADALHQALTTAGIQSLVLVTCNRTEVVWCARTPGDDVTVASACDAVAPRLWTGATRLDGAAVAWHLFRVCAGLESLVQGEAEILGQVRGALEACTGAGPLLRGVVQAALRAGRMARAETAIGVGARSVASAAVHLVAAALPPVGARVVVVGAGATGQKLVTHLRALGVADLTIANRSLERAREVASAAGVAAIDLRTLPGVLPAADAVLVAVHGGEPLLTLADLGRAVSARAHRPLLVADISMPPAVEPGDVPGVTRIDFAAIETFVRHEQDRRAAEVPAVEAVLAREMRHLDTWVRRQTLRPLVSGVRRKVEAIRRAEIVRVQAELGAHSPVDAAILERLSRRLLDQVLAVPLATLETGALPLDDAQADYLRRLFALDRGATS